MTSFFKLIKFLGHSETRILPQSKNFKMGAYVSTPEALESQIGNNIPGPSGFSHSRQSSISSESSGVSTSSAQRAVQSSVAATQSASVSSVSFALQPDPAYPIDPLSRDYPKPTGEVNLDEMLARKPKKWTLGHYITETSTRKLPNPVEDKQQIVQDLEAKKRELLDAKEYIQKLTIPK